jgi:extradiol dioxygenase family protein
LPLEMGEVVYHRDGTIGVYVKDPFGNYLEYIWYSDDQKEVFLDD